MKTFIVMTFAAALLAACNVGLSPSATQGEARGQLMGSEQFELRIRGVNPGHVETLLFGIRELRVEAPAGAVLEVGDSSLALTGADHAWLLGRITVPAGTTEVKIVAVFDDFGGVERDSSAASVRARGAEVAFTAPIDSLRLNGHAVIELDLTRSLSAMRDGDELLLPVLAVHY